MKLSTAGARADALVLLPALLTLAVTFAWLLSGGGYEARPTLEGGYDPNPWYLGALALILVLGATLAGTGAVRLSRAATVASAALAAYTLWSFASTLWAADQGAAFLGSVRTLVYLATFVGFAMLPWRARPLLLALATLVAGIGVIALITAIKIGVAAAPSALYIHGRLSYPLGYENATAALFMLAAMTAIVLSAQRAAPAVPRVFGLVLAAVCLQLAVLTQSRGWLFTVPVVVVLTLLVVPNRLRLLVFALAPALATAASTPALLAVYSSANVHGLPLLGAPLQRALHQHGAHAAHAMLLADAVLALLVAAMVFADRRLRMSKQFERRVNRMAAALAGVALVCGVAVAVSATHGHPVGRLERAWDSFASVKASSASSSRFTSLGSQRVDFWRVALREFRSHPVEGIGQDNFADAYVQQRRTDQEPRWTHSLELRVLTGTGLIGGLLLAGFLVAALGAAWLGRSRAALAASAALTPFIVWAVHGSIDWFWEIPALTVPSLAFLGAAGALARGEDSPRGRPLSQDMRSGSGLSSGFGRVRDPSAKSIRLTRFAALVATVAALIAIGVPFVASRYVQRALSANGPSAAYADLRSASDLLPFDAQIDAVAGSLAMQNGNLLIARRWFAEARRHDSQSWLAPFALGLLESERHHRKQALALLARAHALNPDDSVVALALARIRGPRPLDLEEARAKFAARAEERFGR